MSNLKRLARNGTRRIIRGILGSAKKPRNPMADRVRELAQDLSDRRVRANAPYKSTR
jgi:hypothetical protein